MDSGILQLQPVCNRKNVEISSYYLYLTTLLSNDSIGTRRVAEELSKSYMKHPDSWKILCMLVNVDSEYKIISERLRALEHHSMRKRHAVSGSIWKPSGVSVRRVLP